VSLQPSPQKGMHHRQPVVMKRKMHQTMATGPSFFLGMFPVSFPQVGHGEPSPLPPPLLLPRLMIMGPAAWAGGGG